MHLTELERFLGGEKAERRAAWLLKRLGRKRIIYSARLSAPLPPDEYKLNITMMNAIDAAMQTINLIIKDETQS